MACQWHQPYHCHNSSADVSSPCTHLMWMVQQQLLGDEKETTAWHSQYSTMVTIILLKFKSLHNQRSDSCFYATYRAFINCFSSSSSSSPGLCIQGCVKQVAGWPAGQLASAPAHRCVHSQVQRHTHVAQMQCQAKIKHRTIFTSHCYCYHYQQHCV